MAASIHNLGESFHLDVQQKATDLFDNKQGDVTPRTAILDKLLQNRATNSAVEEIGNGQDKRIKMSWIDNCLEISDDCATCEIPLVANTASSKTYEILDCVSDHFNVSDVIKYKSIHNFQDVVAEKYARAEKNITEKMQLKLLTKIHNHVLSQSDGTNDPTLNVDSASKFVLRGQTLYVPEGWGSTEFIAYMMAFLGDNRMDNAFILSGNALQNQAMVAGYNQNTLRQDLANAYGLLDMTNDGVSYSNYLKALPTPTPLEKSFFIVTPESYYIADKNKYVGYSATNPYKVMQPAKEYWEASNRFVSGANYDVQYTNKEIQITNVAGTVNQGCEVNHFWKLSQQFDMFFTTPNCDKSTGIIKVICGDAPPIV